MRTIGATLRAATARVPSRPAQVFGDSSYSYSELDAVVDRVAGVLAERGTVSSPLTGRTSAPVRLANCCFAARLS
jgi:acyl-CoA synthetase (AMP-forming)/AMP-acid ligase II